MSTIASTDDDPARGAGLDPVAALPDDRGAIRGDGRLGRLSKSDRFHLINGYLVAKMTQNPPHGSRMSCAARSWPGSSPRLVPYPAAKPIRLPGRDSEPEPDRCVVRGTIRDYEERHPGPDDIALVVEVADSSLAEDREMATEVYGPAGIPVYWIVNLVHRQVEVYTDPGPEGYRSRAVFAEGQSVPVVIDGQQLGRIAVADILPSRPATAEAEGNGA